jgi:hypothetical protein
VAARQLEIAAKGGAGRRSAKIASRRMDHGRLCSW